MPARLDTTTRITVLSLATVGALFVFLTDKANGGAPDGIQCYVRTLRVAVDIGHTPHHYGATSARGKTEYEFNSRFAQELVARARDEDGLDLFLLDPEARRTGLSQRPMHAKELDAHVFLSIHHDHVNSRYLKSWKFHGKHLKYADVFRGYSLFVSEQNADANSSLALAQAVGRSLAARGLTPTLHHAEKIPGESRLLIDEKLGIYEAPFAVLRLNTLPAVLFEVGVIAHRAEELALEDSRYRTMIQDALIAGLKVYCSSATFGRETPVPRQTPHTAAPPVQKPAKRAR